jgi:hypothetical protein
MRWKIYGGLLALTALAVVGGNALAAAPAGRSPDLTLRFRAMDGIDSVLDLGDPGPSQGDEFIFSRPMFDESGNEVGTAADACIQTDPATGAYSCTAALSFDNASISIQGSFTFSSPEFDFAVTGGTGVYQNVRGVAHIKLVSQEPPLTELTLFLSR